MDENGINQANQIQDDSQVPVVYPWMKAVLPSPTPAEQSVAAFSSGGFSMMSGSNPLTQGVNGPDGTYGGSVYKDIVAVPARGATSASTISQIDFKWLGNITTGLSQTTVDTTEVKATMYVYGDRSGTNTYDTPLIAIGGTWNGTLYAPNASWGTSSTASLALIWIHPADGIIQVANGYQAYNGTTWGTYNLITLQPNASGFQLSGGTTTAYTLTVSGSTTLTGGGTLNLGGYTFTLTTGNLTVNASASNTTLTLDTGGTLNLAGYTLTIGGASKTINGAGTTLTLSSNITIAGGGNTLTLAGAFTTAAAVSFAGAFGVTITSTASTSVTLPTSGTLVTTTPTAASAATSQLITGAAVDQIPLALRGSSNVTNRDIVQFYKSGTTQSATAGDAGVNYNGIFYGNGSLLTNLSAGNINAGVLALNYGGTGAALNGVGVTGGLTYLSSSTAMTVMASAGSANQLLISGPSWENITSLLTSGTGISSLGSGATATIAVNTSANFTWSGQHTFSYAPATGVTTNWTIKVSASPFGQTSGAMLELGPGPWDGSTSGFFTGSANGTYLAINAATAYAGDFVNYQVQGVSQYKVSGAGAITATGSVAAAGFTISGNSVVTSITSTTAAYGAITLTGANGITVSNSGSTITITSSGGTIITGSGTANYVAYFSGTNVLTSEAQLAVSRGGTNKGTWTANSVPYISATNTFNEDNSHFQYTGSTNQELLVGTSTVSGRITLAGTYSNSANMMYVGGTMANTGTTIDAAGILVNPLYAGPITSDIRNIYSVPNAGGTSTWSAVYGLYSRVDTATGATGAVTNGYGLYVAPGNVNGGAIAGNTGVHVAAISGTGSVIGVRSQIPSGASKWNFYADGTANNAFTGNSYFGGTTVPTGLAHFAAGTTTVPVIQFTTGVQLTTATVGALEWDGSNLYIANAGPTRRTILYADLSNQTGIVTPTYGGTGANNATPSNGQILVGNGTNFLKATLGTGTFLTSTSGAGTLSVDLKATNFSSTVPTGNTYTVAVYDASGYLYGNTISSALGSNSTVLANKGYVDALVQGATVHQSVRVASISTFETTLGTTGFGAGGASGTAFYNAGSVTTNQGGTYTGYITLAPTTTNNTTGQSVATSSTNPVIYNAFDAPTGSGGSSINIGDRVLIKDFSTSGTYNAVANTARSVANGIYVVQTTGTTPFTIVLVRATDAAIVADLGEGAYALVEEGATQKYTGWTQIDSLSGTIALNPATAGASTAASAAGGPQFAQFNGLSSVSAGQGITLAGNVINANIGLTNGTNLFQILGGSGSQGSGTNNTTLQVNAPDNTSARTFALTLTGSAGTGTISIGTGYTFTIGSTGTATFNSQTLTLTTSTGGGTLNLNSQTLTMTATTGSGTLNLNSYTLTLSSNSTANFNGQTLTLTSSTGGGTLNLNSQTLTVSGAGMTLTGNADGFSVAGGTTSRTLTVTSGNVTVTGGSGYTLTLSSSTTLAGNGYTLTMGGNLTTAAAVTFSGAYAATLTLTAATTVTLPISGTLITSTPSASQSISGGAVNSSVALQVKGSSGTGTPDVIQFYQNTTALTNTAQGADAGVTSTGIFYGNGSLLTSITAGNITGTVSLTNGGTGANLSAAGAAGGIVYKASGTAMGITTAGTAGQLVLSGGASTPTFSSITTILTAGTGITSLGSGVTASIAVDQTFSPSWSGTHTFQTQTTFSLNYTAVTATTYAIRSGPIQVVNSSTTTVPLYIRHAASPSTNIAEFYNSTPTLIASISNTGQIRSGSGAAIANIDSGTGRFGGGTNSGTTNLQTFLDLSSSSSVPQVGFSFAGPTGGAYIYNDSTTSGNIFLNLVPSTTSLGVTIQANNSVSLTIRTATVANAPIIFQINSAERARLNDTTFSLSSNGTSTTAVRFYGTGNTTYTELKAVASPTSTSFTLPSADGTANQVLQTNGSAGLSFGNVATSVLTGTVAMSNGGTGANLTGTAGQVVYTNTTTTMAITSGGATNSILQFNSGSAPTWTATPSLTTVSFTAANTQTPITVLDSSDSSVAKFRVDLINQAVILGADVAATPRDFPIAFTASNLTGASSYNAVAANTLVKINSYGGVTQLATTDDVALAIGVALNAVTSASAQIVYVARFGKVSTWSDTTGGGAIAVGDYLVASTNTAGYLMHSAAVRPLSGASYFGRALTANASGTNKIDVLIDITEATTTGSGTLTGSGLSTYYIPVVTATNTFSNSMVQQDAATGTILTVGSAATHRVVIGGSSNGANSGAIALPGNTQTTAAYGITFASDVNAYRSAASTLKTDGSFVTGAAITATTSVTATTTFSAGAGGLACDANGNTTIKSGSSNGNSLTLEPNADASTGNTLQLMNAAGSSTIWGFAAHGTATFTPNTSGVTGVILKNLAADDSGSTIKLQILNSSSAAMFTVDASGNLAAKTKSFDIVNPVDPTTRLRYGSLEGPEHGAYHRGKFDGVNGEVRVDLPNHWKGLIGEEYTIMISEHGNYKVFTLSQDENGFVVKCGGLFGRWRKYGFSYVVIGSRRDAVIDQVVYKL